MTKPKKLSGEEQDQYEEWWRDCSKQRQALADRYDKLEQQRDELREMLEEWMSAWTNNGKTTSLHEWNEGMVKVARKIEALLDDSRKLMGEK